MPKGTPRTLVSIGRPKRITKGMEWRRSAVAKVVEESNRWTKSIGLISNEHEMQRPYGIVVAVAVL